MPTTEKGLICAYLLDGKGGGRQIHWEDIKRWEPSQGVLWVHLDYTSRNAKHWLKKESGLDAMTAKSMLMDDVRPRCISSQHAVYLSLRGVNLNPGQDPEDMVSIRIWLDRSRVITARRRPLLSVNDLREAIGDGRGPTTSSALLIMLNNRLINRMADVIDTVSDNVDILESEVVTAESRMLRPQISDIRRQAVLIRRYLYPQREALYQLQLEKTDFFSYDDLLHLREASDRMNRYIEDLDTARERASIAQEELSSRISEQMDTRMYLLSVVAVIFLPLTFITGLLGINVAGIPGADHPWAFLMVCGMMAFLLIITLFILRKKHWL